MSKAQNNTKIEGKNHMAAAEMSSRKTLAQKAMDMESALSE